MKPCAIGVESLAATQRVAAQLFPWEQEHQEALAACVDPESHGIFLLDRGLENVRCWILEEQGRVGGIGTLYAYTHSPQEVWLAWFGLQTWIRSRGMGSLMLDHLICVARAEGRSVMRLWTTDEAEYAAASSLYLRRGFRPEPVPALPGESWRTLVFSLGLDGRQPQSYLLSHGDRELCGRVAPRRVAVAA